jgi:Zn-dependent protease
MASSAAFRLLGFPVHVRPGFLMFMVLVIFINGPDLGLWLAGFLALFTLLHELGHAVAARATGARAEIALDFLYGYASFVPTRHLRRWERAGISFAGPATQIILSVAALAAMGVNPLDRNDVTSSYAALALWWAGPVIGLFNLVPILPFDGGNIAMTGLELVAPKQARTLMLYFSLVVTLGAGAYFLTHQRYQGLAIFAMIPLIAQLQLLTAHRDRARGRAPQTSASIFARAEAQAWATGDVDRFVAGQLPSPWFRAAQQLRAGHHDTARQVLLADFDDTDEPNWWPPDAAPVQVLDDLVALLPEPLPTGRLYSEFVLAGVLLRLGRHETAARYAGQAYRTHPSPMLALAVARGAAALDDRPTALGWLRAAVGSSSASEGLRQAVASAPEFDALRDDPEFESITHAAV